MKKFIIHLSFILFPLSFSLAQSVYEPVKLDIYQFLDRMNIKGIILLDSEVKPYSRWYIAGKLIEIELNHKTKLSGVDKEELEWYMAEYGYEVERQSIDQSVVHSGLTKDSGARWFNDGRRLRLFSYEDSLFQFKINPVFGYGILNTDGLKGHNRRIGLRTYLTIDNWFGGSLHMTDNGEFGDNVDREKYFTPKRGRDEITAPNGIEFSDVRAQLNFNWSWGAVSLRKDYLTFGNSYFGNVILSDKAPSFPHFYLELKPTDWFRFYYAFGAVHSGIIDSARTIIQNQNSPLDFQHEVFVKKYFVSNLLTMSPYNWLDLSFGNSIVYAGDIRMEMFIPYNFFKYMDRDTGKRAFEDGNGALHFEAVLRYPQAYKFYFSTFIDVTSIRALVNNNSHETWCAYTLGGRKVDLLYDNFDLTVEYTKVTPWVYEHKLELTNYKHLGNTLGHWIGQNADQFRVQFDYQPIRGVKTKLYYEHLRKGGLEDVYYAYDSKVEEFLYGEMRSDNIIGLNIKYEPIHDFFVELDYKYSDISDEMEGRTLDFLLGNKHSYSFDMYYGIP